MDRRADIWFNGWCVGRREKHWGIFVDGLCEWFGDCTLKGIIGEFNKLGQWGTLLGYQEKFDELRSLMLAYNLTLTEEHFISSFISGLEEELRTVVTMMRPQSLNQAFQFARLEEFSNEARRKKMRQQSRPFPNSSRGSGGFSVTARQPETLKPSSKPYSAPAATRTGMANCACYKCGEKYFYGHVCKAAKKQLNALQAEDEDVIPPEPWSDEEDDLEEVAAQLPELEEVTMQALGSGGVTNSLIVQGKVRKQKLMILVDTGSQEAHIPSPIRRE
ncbi:unnamed protein product [Linum trigynum]|uniref:Retrotransposon gag domain-containing protein n=1 Tax=Linum trigynum TaxID=586398 RepID=A0AAV2FD18_9ROSI